MIKIKIGVIILGELSYLYIEVIEVYRVDFWAEWGSVFVFG